jgi:hypothetical protein
MNEYQSMSLHHPRALFIITPICRSNVLKYNILLHTISSFRKWHTWSCYNPRLRYMYTYAHIYIHGPECDVRNTIRKRRWIPIAICMCPYSSAYRWHCTGIYLWILVFFSVFVCVLVYTYSYVGALCVHIVCLCQYIRIRICTYARCIRIEIHSSLCVQRTESRRRWCDPSACHGVGVPDHPHPHLPHRASLFPPPELPPIRSVLLQPSLQVHSLPGMIPLTRNSQGNHERNSQGNHGCGWLFVEPASGRKRNPSESRILLLKSVFFLERRGQ